MGRALLSTGCMLLVVILGICVMTPAACSQTGIIVSPENPSEIDSLEITINAESNMNPVWIFSTSCEVTAGSIKISADLMCGIYYMVTPSRVESDTVERNRGVAGAGIGGEHDLGGDQGTLEVRR